MTMICDICHQRDTHGDCGARDYFDRQLCVSGMLMRPLTGLMSLMIDVYNGLNVLGDQRS
jgi:hypothetical protein